MNDLSIMNQYKHLAPKEFDARLGALLKEQAEANRARLKEAAKKKKSGGK
jgi:hypothetical protein